MEAAGQEEMMGLGGAAAAAVSVEAVTSQALQQTEAAGAAVRQAALGVSVRKEAPIL